MSHWTRSLVLAVALCGLAPDGSAANYRRQYYDNSWAYNEINNYHYCKYYYYPTPASTSYHYHYVIYYPARPRYVYYYNPTAQYYWGRFEIDDKGQGKGYSLLEEKDRKKKLDDIAESAFPKPGAMPAIPESTDKEAMDKPPIESLPKEKK